LKNPGNSERIATNLDANVDCYEGSMTSEIEIRVKLRNLQTIREQYGVTGTNHFLQRIENFLRRRVRGTDRLEQDDLGEFRLSVLNADSGCLPALQRRFSASALQGQLSNMGVCNPDFHVETEVQSMAKALGGEGFMEGLSPVGRQASFRR
jgi:hypothetical protein